MKNLFLFLAVLALPVVADNVSVIVNGTTYQCSGQGGGTSPMNLCRCRLKQHSSTDWDYYLEKYNPANGTYTEINKFTANDSNQGVQDKALCEEAKNEPGCFFAGNRLNTEAMRSEE